MVKKNPTPSNHKNLSLVKTINSSAITVIPKLVIKTKNNGLNSKIIGMVIDKIPIEYFKLYFLFYFFSIINEQNPNGKLRFKFKKHQFTN